jgi:alkylation response protein AidB-like acyl-CoA dehydrogenase
VSTAHRSRGDSTSSVQVHGRDVLSAAVRGARGRDEERAMTKLYGWDADASGLASAVGAACSAAAEHAADVDAAARFPRESVAALAGGGLLGLCVARDRGGRGFGPRAFATVAERLAEACGSTAMVYVMHVTAAQAIASSTTLAGRDALLGEIAAGRHLTTLAFSEKGSRSQFWAPVSRLAEVPGGYVTDARKSWVTSASAADSYVSSAQAPAASSPMESTCYLVRRGAKGVRSGGGWTGLGLRGNDSAPVEIEGMSVPQGDLLCRPGDGAAMMLQVVLPWFIVGTAAMSSGLCNSAVAATAGHLQAAGFEHSGTKLRDLPQLRARLAEMSVRTELARSLLARLVAEMDSPTPATPLLALQTRTAALEAAAAVTDLAMKACGGAAFSKHLPLERVFRDARAGWVMAPTVDHLNEFIGRALTGLPLF